MLTNKKFKAFFAKNITTPRILFFRACLLSIFVTDCKSAPSGSFLCINSHGLQIRAIGFVEIFTTILSIYFLQDSSI